MSAAATSQATKRALMEVMAAEGCLCLSFRCPVHGEGTGLLASAYLTIEDLQSERDEARKWLDDHFVGHDDDPDDYTFAQMLDRLFAFGDQGWGHAGRSESSLGAARQTLRRIAEPEAGSTAYERARWAEKIATAFLAGETATR